jgi:hypothetical protein
MTRSIIAIAIALGILAAAASGQQPCTRHTEAEGGFSYCPPAGWLPRTVQGKKYTRFSAPAPTAANMNVNEEASSAPLKDYVDAGVKDLTTPRENAAVRVYNLVSRTDFVTASKVRGVRLLFTYERQGLALQGIQYIFNGKGGKKLTFTGTTLAADSASARLFDDAMKTFRMEP